MTEAVKHTPAPWAWQRRLSGFCKALVGSGSDVFRANGYAGAHWIDVSNEDANLIEAAPDLYGALRALQLQALQSSVNHAGNEWGLEALAMTKAALAKAEGRS